MAKSHVRTALIIVSPPGLDYRLGLGQHVEPVQVQAFIPQRPAERLDKGVICWLARPREVDPHPVQIGPVIEQTPSKLRPIVYPLALRLALEPHKLVQDLGHPRRPRLASRMHGVPLSHMDAHHGQNPDLTTVEQVIRMKS